jgi:[ribosomal protein S5]-alanine N-acetyltransferase
LTIINAIIKQEINNRMNSTIFTLRDFVPRDAESVALNANSINVSKYLHDRFPYPYSLKDALEFIEVFIPAAAGRIFAIDVDGAAVGAIGLHLQKDEYRMNAELGYWLGESYWNKGIITSAINKITTFGFENLDINKIYAKVFEANKVSCIVLVKNGYKLEAQLVNNAIKNGKYTDELIYTKFRE